MPLTDTSCRNAKPKDKPYFLGDSIGLGLYVRTSGVRSWQYRYRNPSGKQQIMTYGEYPSISLQEVREKHRHYHKMRKEGLDPKIEASKFKLQRKHQLENTFKAVAVQWHTVKKDKWKPKYAKTIMNRLESDVFPLIGHLPISDITPLMIVDVMHEIEKRGVYEVQRRILRYISQVFRYALPKGLVTHDATIGIIDNLAERRSKNHASISPDEFPEFLVKFHHNKARSFDITKLAFEMMMLTFLRTDELIGGRWEEIDWHNERWIIPAPRMKMKREHIIPLSKQAIKVLKRLQEINGDREHIFASPSKPRQPISNNTVLAAIYRMGYKGRMTGHGFRSLATTALLENKGYKMPVIDMQLSHEKEGVHGRAYDRALYLDKRIKMMQDWADFIDAQYMKGLHCERQAI